jgi:uncharacterized membrane protein YphA (DoxX/SURF4 family)
VKLGVIVYGLGSIAAGILDLIWGGFDPAEQPIQAFGDHIPGVRILAYIAAVWLIAGGAAILWRRSARAGAVVLAVMYAIFGVFSFPRFYTAPHYLGHHVGIYLGVLGGVCQEIIMIVAAAIVYAWCSARGSLTPRAARIARWIFGLCVVDFGLAHLTDIPATAAFVPKWIPLGGAFWAVFTGIAFVVAGLAIVTGILDVLATRLLALMLLVFSALALAPMIFASPHDHGSWGTNAYNLAAVGAVWIVADWLATRRRQVQNQQNASPAKPSPA